jgi:hypothetical protein
MKGQTFKNIFSGELVTVTDTTEETVEYEKIIPVQVGPHVITCFRKPRYAFEKAYSRCKK